MFHMDINSNKDIISLEYEDKHMKEWYHPGGKGGVMGWSWRGYLEEKASEREIPFYPADKLYSHLIGLSKKYSNYIILDYRFDLIGTTNYHTFFGNNASDDLEMFGKNDCGELFPTIINMLKPLLPRLIEERAIVDRFYVVITPSNPKQKKRKRTHVPRGLRKEVFKRDNYRCVECGASKDDGAVLHVDHKVPVSKGGTDELENLQTLCSDCNLNKSDVIQ